MTAQFVVFRGIAIAALSALLLACSPSNGTILPAAQRAPAPAVNWTQPDTETLKAAVMDNRMRAFYEARAWRPAWI